VKTNLIQFISSRSKLSNTSDCIEWSLSKDKNGYGKTKLNGKSMQAHRLAWIAYNGDIPHNLLVCHSCDNPSCINPNHLFLGTSQDNMTDKMKKGRYRGGPIFWNSNNGNSGNHRYYGSLHHNAKLADDKIPIIKDMIDKGYSCVYIAKSYGVSDVVIGRIKHGLAWKHAIKEGI
jgi:hypothetical protein